MQLRYDISDRPDTIDLISLALQQMFAILAATVAVPMIVGSGMSPSAAMFGAGTGTIVYLILTKRRSPMFLGSSFSFLGSMLAAFAGGVSAGLGMCGLIFGAFSAGLVYVLLAAVVKRIGVDWIGKLMPPVVIGPTVSVIGLSLAGNAINNMRTGNVVHTSLTGETVTLASEHITILCGLITFFVTILCSVYGKKILKLIPFLIGIIAGYISAAIFTAIGNAANIDAFKIIDFGVFSKMMLTDGKISLSSFLSIPDFVFFKAINGAGEFSLSYAVTIISAYVPVAFVGFAEHIADHKNLSSIINRDLLTDPGLDKTLLGDGLGSIAGAVFGGCPNTTYGESIACVALTGNASTATTLAASAGCILFSFVTPIVAFIGSIPACIMGGLCIALYGFIAVSGLKMIKHIDFDDNKNIFVVSVILIAGIGNMSISFGSVTITEVAAALLLGMITNIIVSQKSKKNV